jgi:hypothetical protein
LLAGAAAPGLGRERRPAYSPYLKGTPSETEAPRKGGNSFYTSYCVVDGKGVLWYNDCKFYLCGRVVGPEWFE